MFVYVRFEQNSGNKCLGKIFSSILTHILKLLQDFRLGVFWVDGCLSKDGAGRCRPNEILAYQLFSKSDKPQT